VSRAHCGNCGKPMVATGTVSHSGGHEVRERFACPSCEASSVSLDRDEVDVRPVKADSRETFDLFDGARYRKFTDAQIEYLAGCVGITWAKAFRAGQKAGPDT